MIVLFSHLLYIMYTRLPNLRSVSDQSVLIDMNYCRDQNLYDLSRIDHCWDFKYNDFKSDDNWF